MKPSSQLLKYIVSGGIAFCSEYVAFYGLYVVFHWPLLAANTISFGLGVIISFTVNKLWTFGGTPHKSAAHRQLGMYIMLAIINACFVNVAVWGLRNAGVDPRIGKLVVMLVIPVWNYFIFKKVIFINV